ncbi:hypothetical protein [Cronobacter phage JC01]|uniref:Uncharacterized protein n=1 Tax=Cronobacter phage JC01 TaxID=2729575 RepID=A0A6M3YNR9_9CAUD|nr:hypothetical protein JT331_gp58 [Cronobacter phage JC01]QJI52295.1 hypothetical protein [Cronobacter phage JC01]
MSNNPNVAGKQHRRTMAAHYDRLTRMDTDMELWLTQIEEELHAFYPVLLNELAESTNPEDEALFNDLDKQYSRQCASLQAARERMTEALTHVRKAVVPGAQEKTFINVTPETFQ